MYILDKAKIYGVPVFIDWTGNTDVKPEEMGTYLGVILAEMNVFPATREAHAFRNTLS